jgi:flagellar basal body-associated protein FliL
MAAARHEVGNSQMPTEVSADIAGYHSPPSKWSSPKGVIYISIALVIVIAGTLLWVVFGERFTGAANGTVPETTLPLETSVVNLGGSGQHAYLRVGISLGLNRPLPRDLKNAPVALARDTILSVLASANPEQSLTSGGRQKLKSDLLKALQEDVPNLGVTNVYFTEFLVQM